MGNRRKTTQGLFNELTKRLVIPLKDNEILCPACKGLRLIYEQTSDKEGYVSTCTNCYNGKLYKCKYCGSLNKTNNCNCKEAEKERNVLFQKEESKKELQKFNKAKKVKFKDYDGKFILSEDDFIKDSDDVEEWLYDKIVHDKLIDEELPKYLWGTQAEPVFDLDIKDIIYNKCEDGYEDMYGCLDTDDEYLEKAQSYLDKWYKKQGDSVNIYYEDCNIAVLLDDLIKKIRQSIEGEKK